MSARLESWGNRIYHFGIVLVTAPPPVRIGTDESGRGSQGGIGSELQCVTSP